MAGIKKEPGPTGRRVAEAIRRIRRGDKQDITTAEMSRRLTAIGQPIPDTSITKTEQGTRRVDADDLVAISLALGVTPNTLLLPQVDYLGSRDWHQLTPVAGGTAEHLWQWAQGERPLVPPVPDEWLGKSTHPVLEFSITSRPYLTALHAARPGGEPLHGTPVPVMKELSAAVYMALAEGATPPEVRRVVELVINMPAVMSREEIQAWIKDGIRPPRKEEQ